MTRSISVFSAPMSQRMSAFSQPSLRSRTCTKHLHSSHSGASASREQRTHLRSNAPAEASARLGNPHAVQLLLGHSRMDGTAQYLDVELEDALANPKAIEM